jgi:eukaryotic-like serine/threonine-protein kinase
MRVRRHLPPLHAWRWPTGPVTGVSARRFALYVAGAALAGYLTAYLILFPAPILPGHDVVPRVIGLPLVEATRLLQKAGLVTQDGGTEPDPAAPAGTVIWQDPPGGVGAPRGLPVTLVSSGGPAKIPVPDVTGLDAALADRLIGAAGLTTSSAESVATASPPGVAMLTRPAAGTMLAPGTAITLVVSRGAPTTPVPDVVGMQQADARTRIELEGLALGTVTRRRTPGANPGTVIAQDPAAGTLAAPGTVVDLVVARSP